LSGELVYRVQMGDELEDMRLKQGESFRITPGTIHQMEAVTDCDILEVSTPELDDVVRLSDRYGREGTSAP
ncbi:MAG TPA: cupin, partial [Gemmatimonadaceae bacterium]